MPKSNITVCTIGEWLLSHTQEIAVPTHTCFRTANGMCRSPLGGTPSGAAAVEAAVPERDAAGVTPAGQACGRPPRGVKAGDGLAADVQHFAVQRGLQAAEGESAGAFSQIDRTYRRPDGLEPLGLFVQQRIFPARR